jgi:hypothetical protein
MTQTVCTVLACPKERDASRPQEAAVQDVVVVRSDISDYRARS